VDSFEEVVADNVYHRAFALGPTRKVVPGTRIITGSLTHVPVRAGDAVEISTEPLGSLAIQIVD
jgi:hypothetical protein